MRFVLLAAIRVYKLFLSPIVSSLGFNCRFYPSCSDYAVAAIKKYGAAAGMKLFLKRIIRCSPLSDGGIDFVP